MVDTTKPYLVRPLLVEQPTWGGDYILRYKQFQSAFPAREKKIGQSYELYGKTVLSPLPDSADPSFLPVDNGDLHPGTGDVPLAALVSLSPGDALGPVNKDRGVPLIKFTQALGNSYQLHVPPPGNARWKPKPESWFYFEPGYVTLGVKNRDLVPAYKRACLNIESAVRSLGAAVQQKTLAVADARAQINKLISSDNPRDYVNVYEVPRDTLIDLSGGGIHHSWEEDRDRYPLGNVLYEIQEDVADSDSTLRSFDKGKMFDDGTARPVHIKDYFANLDTDPSRNSLSALTKKPEGTRMLSTDRYSLDLLVLQDTGTLKNKDSYSHLFVKEGVLLVQSKGGVITVGQGHSCFIPFAAGTVQLIPKTKRATVLRAYAE